MALLLGLYLTSLYSFLLFHSIVEVFSIVIACGIFMVAWNARKFSKNDYLLFLGTAYLYIAGLDFLHTLAYTGMGVFLGYKANLPAQLWIAARYMEGISLFIAPFMFNRKIRERAVFIGYTIAGARQKLAGESTRPDGPPAGPSADRLDAALKEERRLRKEMIKALRQQVEDLMSMLK